MTLRVLKAAFVSGLALARPIVERAGGRVPRVHLPDPVGRKRSGGWVERVGGRGGGRYARRHAASQGGALMAALGAGKSHGATRTSRRGRLKPRRQRASRARRCGARAMPTVAQWSNAAYEFWLAGPSNPNIPTPTMPLIGVKWTPVLSCKGDLSQPLSTENRVVVPAANLGGHVLRQRLVRRKRRIQLQGRRAATQTATRPSCTCTPPTSCSNRTRARRADNVSGELASAPVVRGDERRDVQRQRSRLGGVRGGVQRRRAGGAEHGGGRQRRAVPERGSDRRTGWRPSCTCARARRR